MTWVAVAVGVGSAAVGAYSANKTAQGQRDAAKAQAAAASSPTSQDTGSTSTTTVDRGYPEYQNAVRDTLGAAQGEYQQNSNNPILRRGVASGATPQVTDLANRLTSQAEDPASNGGVNAANSYIQNVLSPRTAGGSGPPKLSDLPPNLQAQVNSGAMSVTQAAARAAQNRPDFAAKWGATGQGTPPATAQDRESAALGSNPVAQDLLGRLRSSNLDSGSDALQRFIAAGGGGTGITSGIDLFGHTTASADPSQAAPTGGPPLPPGWSTAVASGSPLGFSGGASAGYTAGPQIQDNSSDNSLFSQNAKAILGGKYMDPNDPALKGYIDALNHQANLQLEQQLSQVQGSADRVGMFGGSGAALESARTRALGLQGINDADAKALFGARQQGLDQITSTLGLVNNRDVAGSGYANQLALEAQRSAAANASAGASYQTAANNLQFQRENAAADRALQLQLTSRGQNLSALGNFVQNNQFGIGQLAGLSSGLDSKQQGAAGLAPALNAAQYTGLQDAFGAQTQVGQLKSQASAQNSAINFQNANAQGAALDQYLARLGVIGSMEPGSSTNTSSSHSSAQGPQYAPGATPDPTGAALTGALGGGLAAWGALGNYSGGGGGGGGYSPQGGVLAGYTGGAIGGVPNAYGR